MKNESRCPFGCADILLPKENFFPWAVIACDQYTSEPAYWEEVGRIVGDAPSTLRLTLPEVYLNAPDLPARTERIRGTMAEYEKRGIFSEFKDAMIRVERHLRDGRVRTGLVGAVDLDAYDYTPGSASPIRATEGTVLSRIPPRVAIRREAPIELPHVMILIDDPDFAVIPPVGGRMLYDTDLMMNGGHLTGRLLDDAAASRVIDALTEKGKDGGLLFAVGDGNHSLATAKACVTPDNPLSRRALAEIVNLHDPALDFEPIYRVVFRVDPKDLIGEAKAAFRDASEHPVTVRYGGRTDRFAVDGLAVGTLQTFLDEYVKSHPGSEIDYIHGVDSLEALAAGEDTVGFLFDGIRKDELFPYVERYGALPRKTFSMGEAYDKRYYMEARRIK